MDSMKSFFRRIRLDGILIASLLIVIGVLFVALPVESSALLCRISGILLVVFGAVSLLVYFIRAYLHDGAELVKGTVLLLSGIFLLVRPEQVLGILTVLFGVLLAADGAAGMADAFRCARAGVNGWMPMLLLSLLALALGCIVMFGTFDSIAIFAGVSLIVDGVRNLIFLFAFSRRTREAAELLQARRSAVDVEE